MKNYLSKNERDNWLLAMSSIIYIENVIGLWGKSLTSEEKRKLNCSITMTKNALKSITDRLPNKEKEKLINHSKSYQIRILSTEGASALEKRTVKNVETFLTMQEQQTLIAEVISAKCADCDTICHECMLYDILESTLTPRLNKRRNCPFAFKTEAVIEDSTLYEKYRISNKSHKKISKRKQNKIKNRFDDED